MKQKRIEVGFPAGTDIKDAVFEAYQLAIKTKSEVVFSFNGIKICIDATAESGTAAERTGQWVFIKLSQAGKRNGKNIVGQKHATALAEIMEVVNTA